MLVLKYRCNSMSPCGGKYLDERTCSGVVSSCDVLNYSNLKLPCFNIPPAPCGWFLKCLAWPDLGYDGMVLGYLCLPRASIYAFLVALVSTRLHNLGAFMLKTVWPL
jgi:hypothetical protein